MRTLFLFFLLLHSALTVLGQDPDIQAQVYYTKAENEYNKGTAESYYECIEQLKMAEKIWNVNSPKILYLKIKALDKLYDHYTPFIYELNKIIPLFFEITNAKTYSIDKYKEIVGIKNKFDSDEVKKFSCYKQMINNNYTNILDENYDPILLFKACALDSKINQKPLEGLSRDTLFFGTPICNFGDEYLYLLKISPKKSGKLYWYHYGNESNWYLANEANGKRTRTRYFDDYSLYNFKDSSQEYNLKLQKSIVDLEADHDYYMYFKTKTYNKNFSIVYSLNIVNDNKTLSNFFSKKRLGKIGF